LRIGAIADLHYGRQQEGSLQPLLTQLSNSADILLICGDLTDHGYPEQARALGRECSRHVSIPIVAVLGNHDFESGQAAEVQAILREAGLTILDGDACEVQGVGFAGTKGFCGGFGQHALGAWGEPQIKQFVNEAVQEALKLETALARIRSDTAVAMLHYSPVAASVIGEPPEIYPFLGSSRLEEPLLRYPVTAVVHGHAHRGHAKARTANGAPVYNVSWPLLQRVQPERPFAILEVQPDRELVPRATA
jgi:Icc-related predicted phosphoesterase